MTGTGESGKLFIKGAREHNLKNIDVEIPRGKLVVITGLSGSGKSSLAFDTIFAEGQRRYVESLSAYARQFLEQLQKPDVDYIEGLSPTISIEQRKGSSNPRSTVATATEIYDYLRLLYARIGKPECWKCGRPITSQNAQQIVDRVMAFGEDSKVIVMSPLIRGRKGEHKDVIASIRRQGFSRVRVDGEMFELSAVPALNKKKAHTIEAVLDRLVVKESIRSRLTDSVELALKTGGGLAIISVQRPGEQWLEQLYSEHLACATCGISVGELLPRLFSFNSPYGACDYCSGLGTLPELDPDLIVPDHNVSIHDGAVEGWSKTGKAINIYYKSVLHEFCRSFGVNYYTPYNNIPKDKQNILLYGTSRAEEQKYRCSFEGVIPNLQRRYKTTESEFVKKRIHEYMSVLKCPECKGARLKPEALAIKVGGMNIEQVTKFSIEEALKFFCGLSLKSEEKKIAEQILKEVRDRLTFMADVGLSYLTLNRISGSLSGGEAQRIRLASQIGSKLVGVCYVLDEPTIGLHSRDNRKLLHTLLALRDLGNTVIVVEHDREVIEASDYLVDLGPGAGIHGGKITAIGTMDKVLTSPTSVTAKYLNGQLAIEVPERRRSVDRSQILTISGACENNLKDVTVGFPLGLFICVTGVSGSGKSSLVTKTLYPALARLFSDTKIKPGIFSELKGEDKISKVIEIDQSPIGKTPRSNPSTYTGIFDEIRKIFAMTPDARVRGFNAGRFSFNLKGGRCESCAGQGQKLIEMHFLPDIYVTCEDCKGKRYNRETLEIKYKGVNIAEVLAMQIEEAHSFFRNFPKLKAGLRLLMDVGLSYIALGQSSTTLSGGEAQRIKLASELGRSTNEGTFYILDEPTTGLHFDDVNKLLEVLSRLVDRGNTVVVIEHNLDVIKTADWIIDLGPEGGEKGGHVVATGRPDDIVRVENSYTGKALKEILTR